MFTRILVFPRAPPRGNGQRLLTPWTRLAALERRPSELVWRFEASTCDLRTCTLEFQSAITPRKSDALSKIQTVQTSKPRRGHCKANQTSQEFRLTARKSNRSSRAFRSGQTQTSGRSPPLRHFSKQPYLWFLKNTHRLKVYTVDPENCL